MSLTYFLYQHLPNVFVDGLLVIGILATAFTVAVSLWAVAVYLLSAATGHGAQSSRGNPDDRRSMRTSRLRPVAPPSMEETFLFDFEKVGGYKR